MPFALFWKDKKNPAISGEIAPEKNEDTAFVICQKNNEMFPNIHHWYEKVEEKRES